MMTPMIRARSGTKVMPVMANIHPAPRFARHPYGISGLRGLRGLGINATGLLVQPGPNGGTQVVDASGNVIYSEAYVAANPGVLSSIAATGVCPGGLLPTYFPGGESVCAGQETVAGGSNTAAAQFNYPVAGACPVAGWCFTGSSMTDPASFTWTGGGTPTSPNPASIYGAAPLPSVYTTVQTPAQTQAIQDATAHGCDPGLILNPSGICEEPAAPTVVANPNVSNVISPPTGQPAVTPAAIANASNQAGNQSMNVGAAPTDALSEAESATGLSGTTLLLIAAGVVALMVFKK